MSTTIKSGTVRQRRVGVAKAQREVAEYFGDHGYSFDYVRLDPKTGEIQLKMGTGFKVVIRHAPKSKGFKIILC